MSIVDDLSNGYRVKFKKRHIYFIYNLEELDDVEANIHLKRIRDMYILMSENKIFPEIKKIKLDMESKYLSIGIKNIYEELGYYDPDQGWISDINIDTKVIEKTLDKIYKIHTLGYAHGNLDPESILFDNKGNFYITNFTYMYNIQSPPDFVFDLVKKDFNDITKEEYNDILDNIPDIFDTSAYEDLYDNKYGEFVHSETDFWYHLLGIDWY